MPGSDVIHPICDRWGRQRNFDFCATVAPTRTWPYMTWIDPDAQLLRVRNKEDDDWLTIGGAGGGGAPADAQYLVLALDGDLSAERRFVPGDGLQATDAGPNGDYTLAVKVADFAGTGLENDGSNNLRIAAAAAGDGLTGGGGSALAVDSTVVRTSGDQTIAGVKTHQNDIILDDGSGDSPIVKFVGGSNDDTWQIWLDNSATAGESDLIIKGPGGVSNQANLILRNVNDTNKIIMTPMGAISAYSLNCTGFVCVDSFVDLQGMAELILDADNDTTLSAMTDDLMNFKVGGSDVLRLSATALRSQGSIFPNLGTTTLAEKLGHIYLGTAKDLYAADDAGGMFQRAPNHWRSPTDHFNAFSGWTWASFAPFDGAPATIDVSTYPSLALLQNDDITEDHFAYQAATTQIFARLTRGPNVISGIRIQDSGDDNNDYVELQLIDGTTAGTFALSYIYAVGGSGGSGTLIDNMIPAFYLVRLMKSGNTVYTFVTMDTPFPMLVSSIASVTWTMARAGILHSQRALSGIRASLYDFVEVS